MQQVADDIANVDNTTKSIDPEQFKTSIILKHCRQYLEEFLPLGVLIGEAQHVREKGLELDCESSQLTQYMPEDLDTLTEQYVKPSLYEEALQKIRAQLAGAKLWVSVTTADPFYQKDSIVNVIVGTLGPAEGHKCFLVNCKVQCNANDKPRVERGERKAFYLDLFQESMVSWAFLSELSQRLSWNIEIFGHIICF